MSTFTDWNGPQGNSMRPSQLAELINKYSELVNSLNAHLTSKAENNVHDISNYLKLKIDELLTKTADDAAAKFAAKAHTHAEYAEKEHTHDEYAEKSALESYVTETNFNKILASYLRISDLKEQKVISDIEKDLIALKEALEQDTFEKPTLKATEHLEGILKTAGIILDQKEIAASVGGANEVGVFYILGMLTGETGTVYIKYSNEKKFGAVVTYAVSTDDTGALSVTTDCDLPGLKFLIVKCSGKKYLAIQSTSWIANFTSTDGVGIFNSITFEVNGVNFVPADAADEAYANIGPNGNCTVIHEWSNGVVGQIYKDKDNPYLTKKDIVDLNSIGTIIAWEGKDIPAGYHACDGTDVLESDDVSDSFRKKYTQYPLIDFMLIKVNEVIL